MPLPSIICPQCGAESYHPTDIRERYCGRCHQFHEMMPAKLIAPGIWEDAAGGWHFSVPALLESFGWPDDAQHREQLDRVLQRVFAEHFPGVPVIVEE